MRKFYEIGLERSGGTPKEYFEKVDGNDLPQEEGEYYTNFGQLMFKEGSFWHKHDKGSVKTVVEWWLTPIEPAAVPTIVAV